jgi:phosphatidylserine decarboxylase
MFSLCNGIVNFATQSPGLAIGYTSAATLHYRCQNKIMAVLMVSLLLMLVIFYRDPAIKTGFSDNVIMGPCYGRVKEIQHDDNAQLVRIIIFLSPMDIHTQTMPVNGYVSDMMHDPTGRFELAYKVNKSRFNEKMTTTILSPKFGPVRVRQIAGKAVRRISNPNKCGKNVKCGEKLGMIKLGSRVDLEIPYMDGLVIDVKKGQYVNGSDTLIAHTTTTLSEVSFPYALNTPKYSDLYYT